MKRKSIKITAALIIIALIFTGCGNKTAEINEADIPWDTYNASAEAFVTHMVDGDFAEAVSMFDRTMKRVVGEDALSEIWTEITARAGAYVSFAKTENLVVDGYYIAHVTSRHENSGVLLRVVFDKNGLIAGLFTWGYPVLDSIAGEGEITQREGFRDETVVVDAGTGFPLSGILSVPDDALGKLPAVVIVHGSGPNDMDLTIYSNKPYRDIAENLAANGVAVLRYNKRTYSYGDAFDGGSTVEQETIEDAIAAAAMLKADPRVDENRVFIIGHSLGGMLAPRINSEGGNFAGLILLAGSPRFLLDISRDQNIAFINATTQDLERDVALAELVETWDKQIDALLELPYEQAVNTYLEAGMSAYYIQDLYEHPTEMYVDEITVPFLIVQGTRDLQVSVESDYELYMELLSNRSNFTFKLYDGLNHLFMQGFEDTSILNVMEEYAVPGTVDSRVLSDITEWIKAN